MLEVRGVVPVTAAATSLMCPSMGSTKLALHGVGLVLSELGPLPDRARQLLEAGVV